MAADGGGGVFVDWGLVFCVDGEDAEILGGGSVVWRVDGGGGFGFVRAWVAAGVAGDAVLGGCGGVFGGRRGDFDLLGSAEQSTSNGKG